MAKNGQKLPTKSASDIEMTKRHTRKKNIDCTISFKCMNK